MKTSQKGNKCSCGYAKKLVNNQQKQGVTNKQEGKGDLLILWHKERIRLKLSLCAVKIVNLLFGIVHCLLGAGKKRCFKSFFYVTIF
jgi:hypothetical protein